MKRLRTYNDMAHVAAWLMEKTGETWESIDVVDACHRHGVIPHIQMIPPPELGQFPDWLRNGNPAEMPFNQDLPRFMAGQGTVEMLRYGDQYLSIRPAAPARIEDLRLSEHAALQLLERMTERKQRDADRAPQLADMPVSSEPGTPEDWKDKARTIADEIAAADARCEAFTTVTAMADRVAQRMRERGISGPRGPVSGATVLRDALQGGRWKRKR